MPTSSRNRLSILSILLGLTAVIGFIDASLIHLKEIAAKTDPSVLQSCHINSLLDCSKVADSSYSHIFSIPVSLIGITYYEAIIFLAICLFFAFPLQRWMLWAISGVEIAAVFFSYYLLFMSYFGIGVFCPYCLVSNLTTTVIAILWVCYLLLSKRTHQPPAA